MSIVIRNDEVIVMGRMWKSIYPILDCVGRMGAGRRGVAGNAEGEFYIRGIELDKYRFC